MPRLTSTVTGVTVNVSAGTAELLGSEWSPAGGAAQHVSAPGSVEAPQESPVEAKPSRRTRN